MRGSVPVLDGERFDGAEFLVDLRDGGGAVIWLASAGHRGLQAPVFKMGQQGLAAKAAGGEGDHDCRRLH